MKNSSNFLNSNVGKNGTALFIAGSIGMMQGCASTTNDQVNNLLTHEDEFSSGNNQLSSQNHEAIMAGEYGRINFSANPNSRSGNITINGEDSSLEVGLQHSESMGIITSAEFSKVNDKWGTLITARVGDEFKSYLVTGLYKGVDYSVKATAGYLNQELEGQDIGQKYLGTEFLKDFSDVVSNLRAGGYVNATSTDSATLSVEEVRNQIDWGTEVVTTTERFEGQDTHSYGLTAEYDIGNSSIDANFGYSNIGGDGLNYGVGYSYNGEKVRPSIEYSRIEGPDFESDMYKSRVDYIIQDNISVGVSYERVENSNNYEDNRYMVNLTYTPGLKTYRKDSREYNHMSLDHTTGANQAMSTLYGKRETTITTEFILDKSRLEQVIAEAESLDSNDFTPASWSVLSSALTQAKNINNQEEPSLDDVKMAFDNLNSAIDQLEERADKTELISLLNQAESLDSDNYTQDSFQLLQSTINASRTVLEDGNASQNEVTQAVNNLENGIDNLESQEAPTRPTFSGSTNLTVGDAMNLDFSSTDANGDSLTYRVVGGTLPSGPSFDGVNGTLTGTTDNVEAGSFDVVASDGSLDSAPVTVSYDIDPVPTPNRAPSEPTFSGSTNLTVGDAMSLNFSSTDPDGDSLTYRVVGGTLPSGTSFNSDGTLTGTTDTEETGSFEVVASDGNLDSDPVSVSYNIEAVNTAPTIDNIRSTGSISFYEDVTDIGVDISDDDLSQVTWQLNVGGTVGSVEGGTFSQQSGTGDTLSGITFTPNEYGNYDDAWIITATITDSGSGDSQTVEIYRN